MEEQFEPRRFDALDGKAAEKDMNEVIDKAGKIGISFNATGIPQKAFRA